MRLSLKDEVNDQGLLPSWFNLTEIMKLMRQVLLCGQMLVEMWLTEMN
jgi:hypothetical protein